MASFSFRPHSLRPPGHLLHCLFVCSPGGLRHGLRVYIFFKLTSSFCFTKIFHRIQPQRLANPSGSPCLQPRPPALLLPLWFLHGSREASLLYLLTLLRKLKTTRPTSDDAQLLDSVRSTSRTKSFYFFSHHRLFTSMAPLNINPERVFETCTL